MSLPQISPMVQAPTCDLGYIRRALGKARMSERTFIAFVGALIEQRGFPRPLPDYRRGAIVDVVTRHSSFYRAAVDCWLDNFLSPEAAAAQTAEAARLAAQDMDANAATLRLIRGGRA